MTKRVRQVLGLALIATLVAIAPTLAYGEANTASLQVVELVKSLSLQLISSFLESDHPLGLNEARIPPQGILCEVPDGCAAAPAESGSLMDPDG